MVNFSFSANKRVLFGSGQTLAAVDLAKDFDGRILLLTGKTVGKSREVNNLKQELKKLGYVLAEESISGEPGPQCIDALRDEHKGKPPAVILALGGGSVVDAGKAVSAMLKEEGSIQDFLEGIGSRTPSGNKIPFIAIPTTAGTGSECTKNAVISKTGPQGYKKSLRHDNYIPDAAIVDPDWLHSLPPGIMASCGMDAFSQLLESYISTKANPVTDALAFRGLCDFIPAFTRVLTGKIQDNDYYNIALGASLSGLTLANAGLATVHGIAGVLGGLKPIPHGTACGLLLPEVMVRTISGLEEKDPQHRALLKIRTLENQCGLLLPDLLLNWKEIASLPLLGEMGFDDDSVRQAAGLSDNKNSPVLFSEEERFHILKGLLQ